MKTLPAAPTRRETVLALVYLALELLVLPTVLVLLNFLLPTPLNEARLNLVFFAMNLLVLGVLLRRYIREMLAASQPGKILFAALWGLLAYWSMGYFISLLIFLIDPSFANLNDQSVAAMVESDFLVSVIGTVILVPPAEELLFRGVIFGSVYRRKPWAAYLVSSLAFSAVHLVGYIGLYDAATFFLSFLQYLPAGIALAWAYARSGSLLSPIIMHTAINAIGVAYMR